MAMQVMTAIVFMVSEFCMQTVYLEMENNTIILDVSSCKNLYIHEFI